VGPLATTSLQAPGSNPTTYLTHRGIEHDSVTTPLQVVFNCSFKLGSKSISFNDVLYIGPNYITNIPGILLRFRCYPTVVTCDIEKAFMQMILNDADRDCCRFLWLIDPTKPPEKESIMIMRYTRPLFGASASPFLLMACLAKLLKEFDTALAKEVAPNLYVDNINIGADNSEQAYDKFQEIAAMLQTASMPLTQFMSNSAEANKLAGVETAESTKVLGIQFNPRTDEISVRSTFDAAADDSDPPTKRAILSLTNGVYDPLGTISPVVINYKVFLQKQWLNNKSNSIKTELEEVDHFINITLWTDSSSAFEWFNGHSIRPQFIQNRVREVRKYVSDIRHVRTNDNPADILSRGTTMAKLITLQKWWHGPTWLSQHDSEWPKPAVEKKTESSDDIPLNDDTITDHPLENDPPEIQDEQRQTELVSSVNPTTDATYNANIVDAERFSKWISMVMTIFFLLRFVCCTFKGNAISPILLKHNHSPSDATVKQLNMVTNDKGLLVCLHRLAKANSDGFRAFWSIDFILPWCDNGAPFFDGDDDAYNDPDYKVRDSTRDKLIDTWKSSTAHIHRFNKRWLAEYLRMRSQCNRSSTTRNTTQPDYGHVRSASIRTPNGRILQRSIAHLYPLEVHAAEDYQPKVPEPTAEPPTRPQRSRKLAYFIMTLLLMITTSAANPCPANTSDLIPVHVQECLTHGMVIFNDYNDALCWQNVYCGEQHLHQPVDDERHSLCESPCRCEKWADGCSYYTGPATELSTIGNALTQQLMEDAVPDRGIRMASELQLFDGHRFFVLKLIHQQVDPKHIDCIGYGDITDSPAYCSQHRCVAHATRFCFCQMHEPVLWLHEARTVPIKAWSFVRPYQSRGVSLWSSETDHTVTLSCDHSGIHLFFFLPSTLKADWI
uniref:Integrase catalytic domain-containing protein n=1 Tax=Panagrellus redivivus TaxID=6233 RepID=A0A7E5A051_PANRE